MAEFKILTQHPIAIDLSVPAMRALAEAVNRAKRPYQDTGDKFLVCELENFANLMHNLIERASKPAPEPEPDNSDLL